jgi:hypothetical protein
MQHQAPRASLLELPPELRIQIYKILLTLKKPLNITIAPPMYQSKSPIGLTRLPDTERLIKSTELLRANKIIHQEAVEVLYGDNTFLFTEPQALRIFACYIGENKAKLRHVRLKIGRAETTRATLEALYPTPILHYLDLGRFVKKKSHDRLMVELHEDEELREASVAFADAGLTVEECEARFAATRICAIDKASGEWEVFLE